MTGFEPGSSGIGRDRSANCATTTAPVMQLLPNYHIGLEHNELMKQRTLTYFVRGSITVQLTSCLSKAAES